MVPQVVLATYELDSQIFVLAVTHWVHLSLGYQTRHTPCFQMVRGGTDKGMVGDRVLLHGEIADRGSHHFELDTNMVQKWIDTPQTNGGLLLKTVAGDANFHWQADGDRGSHPPRLTIQYE